MPTMTCYLIRDDDYLEVEVTYRIFPPEPEVGIFTNQVEIVKTIPDLDLSLDDEEDLQLQILAGDD